MLTTEEKVELLQNIVLYNDGISRILLQEELPLNVKKKIIELLDKYLDKINDNVYFDYKDIQQGFDKIGINKDALRNIMLVFYKDRDYLDICDILKDDLHLYIV